MQRQSRTGFIPIDEARIRDEVREACFFGGSYCELLKCRGHGGPGAIHLWVDLVISIAGSVRYPPERATVRHGNRHAESPRCHHIAKWRPFNDILECSKQLILSIPRTAASNDHVSTENTVR